MNIDEQLEELSSIIEQMYVDESVCFSDIYEKEFADALACEIIDKGYRKTDDEEMITCTNITQDNPVEEFVCSKCGFIMTELYSITVDDSSGKVDCYEFEIKYCPNCGAKVVEK